MASHSGIRASSSDHEYARKPILKNAAGYGTWETKMSTILEAEECWELVQGFEPELSDLRVVVEEREEDGEEVEDQPDAADPADIAARVVEIMDSKRRYIKAASLITQSVDDSMVQMLKVHKMNPIPIWATLAADYNTVTPAQQAIATHDFLGYIVSEDDSYLTMKHHFDELLRKVIEQGGSPSARTKIQTLLGALPEKFDMLRESFYAQTPTPPISYFWARMCDMDTMLGPLQ